MSSNQFVTIKTFTHPNEAAVIVSRLESEGIECFLKDGLTAQINPFYSNAIGGVKLQVRNNTVERAIEILIDGGYSPDEEPKLSPLYQKADTITSKIPFLKNTRLEVRLAIIIPLFLIFIVSILFYVNLPSTYEKLMGNRWCVDYVTHKGENYQPNSIVAIKFIGYGFCEESLTLSDNGQIFLPGFNCESTKGSWSFENDVLHIYRIDTLRSIYEGEYTVAIGNNQMTLKSALTTIYCFPTRY